MDDLLSVIDFIPHQWRGFFALTFLLLPRIIQKMKATEDFKFFGSLPEILTRAQQQRQQILDKIDLIQYDVALLRKFVRMQFDVTEEDIIHGIRNSTKRERNTTSSEESFE